jgi:hypothetical protein
MMEWNETSVDPGPDAARAGGTNGSASNYADNVHAYESTDYKSEPFGAILLIDLTALGSAKDGIFITDTNIYIKPMYEPRTRIRIKDINSLRLDESDREIAINGKYYSYAHSSVTPAMRVVVKCLNKYLEQFA